MKFDLVIRNAEQIVSAPSNDIICGRDMCNLKVIRDSIVGIKDGKIRYIGKNTNANAEEYIDAKNKIVIPGLVDCHTHILFTGSRETELEMKLAGKSYIDILNAGGGIYSTVKATRNSSIDELVEIGKKRLIKMLMSGTTTVEVKTGYGLNKNDELKMIDAINELKKMNIVDIATTYLGAHAIPEEMNADEYIKMIIQDILPLIKNKIDFCDVFCEKNVFSIEQTRKIIRACKSLSVKTKIHADELTDMNGAKLGAEEGCISCDHLLKSNDEGIKSMAKTHTIGVLLPGTSFTSFENYANARLYISYNLPIALATDFNPNCWIYSLFFVMYLACYNMKMTTEEILNACTINAARALNRTDIGIIDVNKKADLVVIDVPNYKQMMYKIDINMVETVIKNGKIVVSNGKLMG